MCVCVLAQTSLSSLFDFERAVSELRLGFRVRDLVWMVNVRVRGYRMHYANECPH